MQNDSQNDSAATKKERISPRASDPDPASTSPLVLNKSRVMATIPQNLADNFMPDLSLSDEEDVSEVESFILDQEELEDGDPSRFLLSHDTIEGAEVRTVDPETQAKLEALLEAAGISKLSTTDGKAYADPEVLRRLTSSVSCALDEAAAALTRMRAEQQAEGVSTDSRSLAKACSNGDISTVRQLLEEGGSVNETTEEGESLLSLACSAGYYELAQVLLAMRANVEDRGIKGDCTPLMEAASGGYVDIVKLLIANGADVNAQSSQGNTPLHYAACGGHEDVVAVLIEATANVEEHNENGHTPLMEAASAGHVGVAKILLDAGAGINTHSNEFKESALTLACYKGHLEMVKFLLEAGADQEHKTDEMHTALMEASMDGHVEVARLLLDSGAQVNMPADSFESPLTLAACGGHVELANLLIERGANLEEVNDEGYTPLMEAAREGHEEMVALLLAHGADINAQTEETQETALTLACCGGFLDVAEFLIKAGADLELGCSTPLMEASQEGHVELVRYLIKAGANVRAQTQTGDTALTYACENGHTDVAEVLLENQGDIEHESEGGRTPVMKAARAGHFSTVQYLISKGGANVNKQTSTNDHTVLSLASAGGHRAVVDLLLKSGANPNHRLKDGSTMLIEAAKGGHTPVVNLLLDWPNNLTNSNNDLAPLSPPQSNPDTNELPRVPIHGLTNIVPPQDPDQVPASDTNNLSTTSTTIGVPQVSGQVNLKDFNIQTKSVDQLRPDQIRPTMQKLLAKSKMGTKTTVTVTTTTATSAHGIIVTEGTNTVPQATTSSAINNNNDPQKPSVNTKPTGTVNRPVSTEAGSLSRSNSQVSDVGSDFGTDADRCNPDVSTSSSSSTAFDSEDKMYEMMKASERLEAFISKMMRRAELLHATSEEQSLQKQQILEELQKVEQELQEKAKNPLLLLNAQSKQEAVSRAGSQITQALQLQMTMGPDGQVYHQPLGMTLPVQLCGNSPGLLMPDGEEGEGGLNPENRLEGDSSLPVINETSAEEAHNGGALSFLGGVDDVAKTPQLAKQESFSSTSNSSSSADSGCGHSDFNGVGAEGPEVDGLPPQTKSVPAIAPVQEEEPESSSTMSSPAEPTEEGVAPNSLGPSEGCSRASSEEVDLTNVIPVTEAKDQSELEEHFQGFEEYANVDELLLHQQTQQESSIQSLESQEQAHIDRQLQALHKQKILQQQVQQQLKSGTDPTKIALGIQQQLQQQQQQLMQQQQGQAGQQCMSSYPVQLEPLLQQPVSTISSPLSPNNSSCREMQLEHQRLQLQAQLELEQAKTKTLQAQLQLQKQIKTSIPQSTAKQQQQLKVHQQTTVTCHTQLAASDLQQLKLQQQLHQLHQQLSNHQLPANQHLSQQELLQYVQQAQQLQLLHQQHLHKQQQQQQQDDMGTPQQPQATNHQVLATAAGQLPQTSAAQLLTQQDLLQQTQQLQQQLQQVQQLQQMQQLAQQQKNIGQYQGNMWPVTTTAAAAATTAVANNEQKKPKKKLLPQQQQQQLLQQQLMVNNQLNTQYANYTTASTNTMATGTNTLYDYLEMITPSSSTPMTPNPSPASPQISPPVYPAIDLDAETESNHDTALTLACAGGHAELVSLLLSRGSDIEHRDKKGFTPLILASTAGHSDVVEILLDHGADIEAQSERTKDTPLSLACSGGRYEVVELLLTRGANKEHRNVSDYTPLSLAASGGYVNIIKLLLSHGAEINSRTGSKLGISPLMLAAMNGHTAAVKLLLDMGSDINAQIETNKNTALTLACFQGRHEVVSLLVDRKANIEHRAKTGLTPLMEAASGGYVEVGRVLLDKGADVNAPPVPSSRDTALTIAADKGHYRFVDLLLSRHAAIDVKNKKGNSPLWLASNGGHLDVVQLLVQANADVDSQDNRKVSCLMSAYRKGHIKVIKWLVKHVTQFPSDQECMRYISTVTDQDLLKKCHQCMDIIVSAKARQAAEANRNASILLEEIDAEKSREETKKAAAARKREKKRKKKKEKQEREREQEKKDTLGSKDSLDCNSKSSSPEPDDKDIDDDDMDDDDDDDDEEIEPPQPSKTKKRDGTDSSLPAVRSTARQTNATSSSTGSAPISNSVTNKNNKNKAIRLETVASSGKPEAKTGNISEQSKPGAADTSSATVRGSSSNSNSKGKGKRKQREKDRPSNKDRDGGADLEGPSSLPSSVNSNVTDSAKNSSAGPGRKVGVTSGPSSLPSNHSNKSNTSHVGNKGNTATGSGGSENVSNGNIPNKKGAPNISQLSSTGIGDLDDFGMLPPTIKVTPSKEKEKKTPEKRTASHALSPAKGNAGKSPGGPSPSKRGSKKEEGWKEVIRNSVRRSKKVTVPSTAISRVIGRNGSNINAIRDVSGAHIDIDKARSTGDRNITIKGSAEATRQAQTLISALIRDPDKELDQIIPKLKNRIVSTNTLTLSTSIWHNSMANGIAAASATTATTVMTTLVSTQTTSFVGTKGNVPKPGTAVTKATGLATTFTTTVTQSAPGKTTTVTNSNMKPQTSTMSNIGVFQVPIGVWKANVAQPSPGKPGSSPGTPARRQLFPGGIQPNSNSSAPSTSAGKQTPTYSSPSMAKTKVVTVADPAIASRVERVPSQSSLSRLQTLPQQPKSVSPGRPAMTGAFSCKEPQPLPIKTSGTAGGKPGGPSQVLPGGGPRSAEYYSPFNNVFSQFAEQVLRKKDENGPDGKMNFASVAAAGVVPTASSHALSSSAAATHPLNLHHRETDPQLQAKAPGYKAPGSQRTNSPQVGEDMAVRAPGYRVGSGPPETDIPRVPGFKQGHFGANVPMMEYDVSRMPEEYGMYSLQQRAQGLAAGEHVDMSRFHGVPPPSSSNISPRSASSTPINTQSPHHHQLQSPAGGHRDEYTTADQPMTLPKIESNLNPNAPDFTFRAQSRQLQQQLIAAQMLAAQQQAAAGGMASATNSNPPFLPPPNMRLPPPFLMNHQPSMGSELGAASSQQQGLPDSLHQMGAFGAGPGGFQSMGSGLGESGKSLSPSLNRQYSPMQQSAARSESAASSVGTSSKGESSSPVLHVSGESSPQSSSAPSPTDQLSQFLDDRLQPGLRPIGSGRGTKKDRGGIPQSGQYGPEDGSTSTEQLWGIARELGSDWMVGSSSLGVSSTVANIALMSRTLQSENEEPRPSSQPGIPPQLIPNLVALENSMLDPATVELALQSQAALLAPRSAGALFASASPAMSSVFPQGTVGGLHGDSLGNMWNPLHQPQGQVIGSDPGAVDPKVMWNNWTPPPTM